MSAIEPCSEINILQIYHYYLESTPLHFAELDRLILATLISRWSAEKMGKACWRASGARVIVGQDSNHAHAIWWGAWLVTDVSQGCFDFDIILFVSFFCRQLLSPLSPVQAHLHDKDQRRHRTATPPRCRGAAASGPSQLRIYAGEGGRAWVQKKNGRQIFRNYPSRPFLPTFSFDVSDFTVNLWRTLDLAQRVGELKNKRYKKLIKYKILKKSIKWRGKKAKKRLVHKRRPWCISGVHFVNFC